MSFLPMPTELNEDLWQYLRRQDKPIVLYGMGNGADKIINVLSDNGMEVADFFASDGFVRGQQFHGKTVLTFAQILEKYPSFIILVAFGSSLQDVLTHIYALNAKYELYVPDVPVCGSTLFTAAFYREHFPDFEKAYDLLTDAESKELFGNLIRYKVTGKLSYLQNAISRPGFESTLLRFSDYRTYIDVGAYNGDTVRKFIADCPNAETIYAIEPDRRNFGKLSAYAQSERSATVKAFHFGAWNQKGITEFSVCGNRNSAAGRQNLKKTEPVALNTVDSLQVQNADYIKYDVEGAEKQALEGSLHTIQSSAPDLLVSAYHQSEDLYALPLFLSSVLDGYDLYLRRYASVPAWDINLYAIKRR